MKIRVSPKLIEPLLWADAVLAGGSLRRAVRNYVGDDPDRREKGLLPLHATGSIARGLWREQSIRPDAFIKPGGKPRFIAASTGRSGTTWLMDLLGRGLKGNHVVIREIGLFDLAQFRGAPYEYFQYANLPVRTVYRRYFREFILRYSSSINGSNGGCSRDPISWGIANHFDPAMHRRVDDELFRSAGG